MKSIYEKVTYFTYLRTPVLTSKAMKIYYNNILTFLYKIFKLLHLLLEKLKL